MIMHQQVTMKNHVEESADELIKKLENQGKRIKILDDDADDPPSTQRGSKLKKGGKKQQSTLQLEDAKVDEI
jgi:hypothetical protein